MKVVREKKGIHNITLNIREMTLLVVKSDNVLEIFVSLDIVSYSSIGKAIFTVSFFLT